MNRLKRRCFALLLTAVQLFILPFGGYIEAQGTMLTTVQTEDTSALNAAQTEDASALNAAKTEDTSALNTAQTEDASALTTITQSENTPLLNAAQTADAPVLTTDVYDLDGDGTKDAVYELSNAAQLEWFAQYVNNNNGHTNAVLISDIDLTGYTHTPIGVNYSDFAGIFDGCGYTIRNMNFTTVQNGYNGNLTYDYQGLFGVMVDSAIVRNFTITGEITLASDGQKFVGGAVGLAYQGSKILNVNSYVNINDGGTAYRDIAQIGGIVGQLGNTRDNTAATVENCKYYGTINIDTAASVGGIAGQGVQNSTALNCVNYGTIGWNYIGHVAGVIGSAQSGTKVKNCVNYGSVSVIRNDCVGGVVGYANENVAITNCANFGALTAKKSNVSGEPDVYLGGILGYVNNSEFAGLTGCFNYGTVTDGDKKNTYTGAIVGFVNTNTKANVIANNSYLGTSCGKAYGTIKSQDKSDTTNVDESKTGTTTTAQTLTSSNTTWTSGAYIATGTVTISSRVTVSGDVSLYLMDNADLTVDGGISVNKDNSFSVYAQSEPVLKADGTLDEGRTTTGKLTVTSTNSHHAAIGSEEYKKCGTLCFYGGIITANGKGYAAAIGDGGKGSPGDITINGGYITASGSERAAGIGYGTTSFTYIYDGSITINGGTVIAGDGCRTGIGQLTTDVSSVFVLTINGGRIRATGTRRGIGANTMQLVSVDYLSVDFDTEKNSSSAVSFDTFDKSTPVLLSGRYHIQTGDKLTALTTAAYGSEAYNNFYKKNAVIIQRCMTHSSPCTWTWTDESGHSSTCSWCGAASIQSHTFDEQDNCTECIAKQVNYIQYNTTDKIFENATAVARPISSTETQWTAGNWVVSENVTIDAPVSTTGNVNLFLVDGVTLTVNGGIHVSGEDTFTIYAQSQPAFKTDGTLDAESTTTGTLIVTPGTGDQSTVGIGDSNDAGGNVCIHGGVVSANGTTAAGISVGGNGNCTVYGGAVTASSTSGAGINIGNGNLTVSGGVVSANGTTAAGISVGGNGSVTVSGGAVTASSTSSAGISTESGHIKVYGGTITANGGTSGTGISITNGEIGVYGGTVTANGKGAHGITSNRIIVSGGTVTGTTDGLAESVYPFSSVPTLTGNYTLSVGTSQADLTLVPYADREDTLYTNTANKAILLAPCTGHNYGTMIPIDETEHTSTCITCGNTLTEEHQFDENGICFCGQKCITYLEYNTTTKCYDTKVLKEEYTGIKRYSDLTKLTSGWYYVSENVTFDSGLTIAGDVNLILKDGVEMTVYDELVLNNNHTFTVYGQSQPVIRGEGELNNLSTTTGKLTIKEFRNTGIGERGTVGGTLRIHGGVIDVSTEVGSGAAIGGAGTYDQSTPYRKVEIFGGYVDATGGTGGQGIGSGNYEATCDITIHGGTVIAQGGSNMAGIGGNGSITINGGYVKSLSGYWAHGIGKGYYSRRWAVRINGGTVVSVSKSGPFAAFSNAPVLGDGSYLVYAGTTLSDMQMVSNPIDSTYTSNSAVKIVCSSTSMDLSWTEMSFTYSDGEWNPFTHSYGTNGWSAEGGTVSVTNRGNASIVANFAFESQLEGVSGALTKNEMFLAQGESDSTTLSMTGTPGAALENAVLGSLTMNVEQYKQGWYMQSGNKCYYRDNELLTGWQTVDGQVYYFDPQNNGYLTLGEKEIDGKNYEFDLYGVLVAGWQLRDGKWYYFDPQTREFLTGTQIIDGYEVDLGSDGALIRGIIVTGPTAYYIEDGVKQTGIFIVDGKKHYFNPEMYCDRMVTLDGNSYYFGADGAMLTNTRHIVLGMCYYFDENGVGTLLTGWQTFDGKQYYFDEKGIMLTGKRVVEGYTCLFDEDGVFQTGWRLIDGKLYYYKDMVLQTGEQVIDEITCFFDEDGVLQTGWLIEGGKKYYYKDSIKQTGWHTINGKTYYFDEAGVMQTGVTKIEDVMYGFDSDGVLLTGDQIVGGRYYTFDENGVMLTGFYNEDGKTYYYKEGVMQTGWQQIDDIYYDSDSRSERYYFDPVTGVMAVGFQVIDGNRYYFMDDGELTINGRIIYYFKYTFDSNGVLQTGFFVEDDKVYYYKDGVKQTGSIEISKVQFEFDSSGAMLTGFVNFGNQFFWLKDGVPQTGWCVYGSRWFTLVYYYYVETANTPVTGTKIIDGEEYVFGDDGCLQTGKVTYNGKTHLVSEGVEVRKWAVVDGKRYYCDTSGVIQTGWYSAQPWCDYGEFAGSKFHYFDENGVLQTGNGLYDGYPSKLSIYGNLQYGFAVLGSGKRVYWQLDEDGNGSWATGWVYADDGNWYYFSNEQSYMYGMLTGWLTLGDDKYYLGTTGARQYGWQQIKEQWYFFDPVTGKYDSTRTDHP